MERVTRLLVFYKEYFTLLLTVVLSTVLLLSSESRQASRLQSAFVDLIGAVQKQFAWTGQIFTALDENHELREQNIKLTLENSLLKRSYIENRILREKLGFKERQPHQFIAATVVSWGLYQFTKVIQIDVGSAEGIKKNLPVLTNNGLVGKILVAGNQFSLVQVLGDVNFSVSAKVQRTQASGILSWGAGFSWKLENIVKSFSVIVGDTISTSGMSSVYPPDLPVGIVTSVSDTEPGMFKSIEVKPFVDFTRLQDVFVILNPPEEEFDLVEEVKQEKKKNVR